MKYVINFDIPSNIKLYVHRAGRTARNENDGVVFTILNNNELSYFQ